MNVISFEIKRYYLRSVELLIVNYQRYNTFSIIQIKNHINITSTLQQLMFTKHFSIVTFKLQLLKLNTKHILTIINHASEYQTKFENGFS